MFLRPENCKLVYTLSYMKLDCQATAKAPHARKISHDWAKMTTFGTEQLANTGIMGCIRYVNASKIDPRSFNNHNGQ
jgi:hypothetical protein